MNFMLPVPLASLPAVENLLRDLAGGHQMLGQRHPVVLQEHHLQLAPAAGIVGNIIRKGVDEVDDPLGHGIARRGLGAEQEGVGLGDAAGIVLQAAGRA